MTASPYIIGLRQKIGHDLLILPSTAIMIFDAHDRFLLLRNCENGLWMTVGGCLEPFEQPADGALREAWEETGLHVELTHIIGVFGGPDGEVAYRNGDRAAYVAVAFGARSMEGRAMHDGIEADACAWFTREEAIELPITNLARSIISVSVSEPKLAEFTKPSWTPPISG